MTQTATITEVKDGTTSIPPNGTTDNTKPVISGSFPTALIKYYSLKLYDNGTLMSDANAPTYTLDGNGNKTAWSFTPDSAFSVGSHEITAKVVRTDGVEGVASAARTFTVSKLSQVAKADGVLYFKTECVKDNNTGLMWEGKPADGTRRGDPALEVNGTFTNIESDSSPANALGYVNAVNKTGLCGFTDWRLPTKDELLGIVDSTVASGPKVDANWFPNTKDYFYWTSSPVTDLNYARVVYFYSGADSLGTRSDSGYVRLVRDTQKFSKMPKAGGGSYEITECVKDNNTGLMWEGKPAAGTKRGSPPLNPNGTYTNYLNYSPEGNTKGYVNAVNSAGLCGFTDWRLPTPGELSGIVDRTRASSPKVDPNWFPNTQSNWYWTSLHEGNNSVNAWGVNFNDGYVSILYSSFNYEYVRLVYKPSP